MGIKKMKEIIFKVLRRGNQIEDMQETMLWITKFSEALSKADIIKIEED